MRNENIHREDWNVLVILDAMRFDYFSHYNPLKGTLSMVEQGTSCTSDWLYHNFPDKYPYVYISGNPLCNQNMMVEGFRGGDHFIKVIDVWKHGWNDEYMTVLPWTIVKASMGYLFEEKVILHFMQPHFPSIGKLKVGTGLMGLGVIPHDKDELSRLSAEFRNIPVEDLIKGYTENVKIIFGIMKQLINLVPKEQKIVITSDHGELLGERGLRSHPCKFITAVLMDVPWFEVER